MENGKKRKHYITLHYIRVISSGLGASPVVFRRIAFYPSCYKSIPIICHLGHCNSLLTAPLPPLLAQSVLPHGIDSNHLKISGHITVILCSKSSKHSSSWLRVKAKALTMATTVMCKWHQRHPGVAWGEGGLGGGWGCAFLTRSKLCGSGHRSSGVAFREPLAHHA